MRERVGQTARARIHPARIAQYTHNPNMLTKYCILYARAHFARARMRAWRPAHLRAWRPALGGRRIFALGGRRLSVTPTFSGAYVHLYSIVLYVPYNLIHLVYRENMFL